MNLNTRQKTFLAIFFVGLVALIADRTLLRPQGGAKTASADAPASSGQSALSVHNVPVLEDTPAGSRLAECLGRLWPNQDVDVDQMRDPFSLPASWSDKSSDGNAGLSDAAARFVARHQLGAVVIDSSESHVLVNDRVLVPGQYIDGFLLVSVSDHSAVFEQNGRRVVLELVNK